MYQYNKYISKHLIHAALLITLSLTSIVWLTQALRFIEFIVNQGISIVVFLKLTILLIPMLLLMILPPAIFCAVLFVYNKLRMDSELVVMQAAGLGRWRLGIPALQLGVVMTLLAYMIALYLQPISYTRFKEMQAFLRNNYASVLLQEGVFTSPMQGLTVFIRERDSNGTLHGILVHNTQNPEQPLTMMAEEGRLVDTPQGPRFLLRHGNRQEMQNGRTAFLNFESYTLDFSIYTKSITKRRLDAREMLLSQLFTYDDSVSPAENQKRRAEGHQRIIWPAYVLCLVLVALAVLQSGAFNRRGQWRRILFASVLGALILFGAVGLRGLMALHPFMVPVAYLNVLVPMIIASGVLSGVIKKRPKQLSLPPKETAS